jgi:hypothetical protein
MSAEKLRISGRTGDFQGSIGFSIGHVRKILRKITVIFSGRESACPFRHVRPIHRAGSGLLRAQMNTRHPEPSVSYPPTACIAKIPFVPVPRRNPETSNCEVRKSLRDSFGVPRTLEIVAVVRGVVRAQRVIDDFTKHLTEEEPRSTDKTDRKHPSFNTIHFTDSIDHALPAASIIICPHILRPLPLRNVFRLTQF